MNNHKLSAEDELSLINGYTQKPLSSEEIFTFTLTLCDNEVDRDFECFSLESLSELEKLFPGKTGISDHSMRADDQMARVFYCYTEKDASLLTSYGEAYTALKARAYMLRTQGNSDLISAIEGGIKKEVSISCNARETICSICGKNMREHRCNHIKGKTYKGKLCYGILSGISDAYEWSFVAVPAQRKAGVTKAFSIKEENYLNSIDTIKSITEDTVITVETAKQLCDYITHLEAEAQQAQVYKDSLIEDISRFAMIIMPSVNSKQFTETCKAMDITALKKFRDDMSKQAGNILPATTQLSPSGEKKNHNNNDFII